jgi:hypothetical protein
LSFSLFSIERLAVNQSGLMFRLMWLAGVDYSLLNIQPETPLYISFVSFCFFPHYFLWTKSRSGNAFSKRALSRCLVLKAGGTRLS